MSTVKAYRLSMDFAFHDRKKIIDYAVKCELEHRASDPGDPYLAAAWAGDQKPVPAEALPVFYARNFEEAVFWVLQDAQTFIEEKFDCQCLESESEPRREPPGQVNKSGTTVRL